MFMLLPNYKAYNSQLYGTILYLDLSGSID